MVFFTPPEKFCKVLEMQRNYEEGTAHMAKVSSRLDMSGLRRNYQDVHKHSVKGGIPDVEKDSYGSDFGEPMCLFTKGSFV